MDADNDASAASRQHFQDKAAEYEKASGGSTSSIAAHLANICGIIDEKSHVMDLAAGPGVVVDALLQSERPRHGAKSARYAIVDPAASMLDIVKHKIESAWPIPHGRISLYNKSAEDLADTGVFPSGSFSHVFCNCGFMFFPDPVKAAESIYRILKPGGKALISTFTHVGYWTAVERATKKIKPHRPGFEPPFPIEWTNPEYLPTLMHRAGFQNIESTVMETKMSLPSVQELAANTARRFGGIFRQQGWSEEELAKLPDLLEMELAKDTDNVRIGSVCAEVKMVANVVVCTK